MEVILLLPGEGFAKPAFLPAWVLLRTSALNLETEKKKLVINYKTSSCIQCLQRTSTWFYEIRKKKLLENR